MSIRRKVNFCVSCRKETGYILRRKEITKKIRDKEYRFNITTAICEECGEEINIPGLIDKNIQEIDEQYRQIEGIVSIEDIERLMKIYKIGKTPLSLTLGFGEITITRYIAGQVPSKEYSDIIRKALISPEYMRKALIKNKGKIASTAYNKAMNAAIQLQNLFSVSDKMLSVLAYLFKNLEEVTPLMLQKLLYFIQGTSYALDNEPMFEEDCQAWVHGPVYPEVYDLFKDFKYNPIDDARFSIIDGIKDNLKEKEQRDIDLVINTFGLYSGKVLECITHNEEPWRKARKGYSDGIPSRELITKESIAHYYKLMNEKFTFDTESGMKKYISYMLEF